MSWIHRGNLLTVLTLEAITLESLLKADHIRWIQEIDKCIANICLVPHIHGEIKEVIQTRETFRIDLLQQGFLRELVGDVSKHRSGSWSIIFLGRQICGLRYTGGMIWFELLLAIFCFPFLTFDFGPR